MKDQKNDLMKLKMENNIFFNPGDLVTLKQDIPNKPTMLVVRKETSIFKNDQKRLEDKKSVLIGIKCRWFTKDHTLQEAIFSTKDLILL